MIGTRNGIRVDRQCRGELTYLGELVTWGQRPRYDEAPDPVLHLLVNRPRILVADLYQGGLLRPYLLY